MKKLRRLWKRLFGGLTANHRETELSSELDAHIQMLVEENLARGMSPDEARRLALLTFGGREQIREECRDSWSIRWVQELMRDLQIGARMLKRNPGFAALSIFTLMLGIGANSAIFSIVDAVLIQPLPFPEPARLISLREDNLQKGFSGQPLAPAKLVDLSEQSKAFTSLAGFYVEEVNLTGKGDPESLTTAMATAPFFPTFNVRPALGRWYTEAEDRPGGPAVAVLSHGLWTRRFGSDPDIIGQTIELSQRRHTILGIMPAEFRYPAGVEVWVPAAFAPSLLTSRSPRWVRVIGRLEAGVPIARAQAEMDAIAGNLSSQYPDSDAGWTIRLTSLHERTVSGVKTGLLILLAAVGLVLLIACVNVANLLLARSDARRKEMALRSTLGASRWRLAKQSFTESLLLALAGGVAGLLAAQWGLAWILSMGAGDIPRADGIRLDSSVVLFTLAVSILTSLLFGVAPAFRGFRHNLNEVLKEGAAGSTFRPGSNRMNKLLIVSEVALALVLLVGAALLIQSLVRLLRVEPGFESAQVVTMKISLPWSRYSESATLYRQVLEQVSALPGVESAGAINFLPMEATSTPLEFTIEGSPATPEDNLLAQYRSVSPGYFTALGIPLRSGRLFTNRDTSEAPTVILVNDAFASMFFPNEDPVEQTLLLSLKLPAKIVGVVGSVRHNGLDREPSPVVYYHYLQTPWPSMTLVLRSESPPTSVAKAVRAELLAIDPKQPVFDIRLMSEWVDDSLGNRPLNTTLLSLFAAIALILAGVGIYGVIAYSVAERRHEIGIRMALGANKSDVLKLMVRQAMAPALLGIALGLVLAIASTGVMESLLFDTSATEPAILVAISGLLLLVALMACLLPARRATRVDPLTALRYE